MGVRHAAACLLLWAATVFPAAAAERSVGLVASPYQNPGPTDDVVVAVTLNPAESVTSLDLVFSYDPAVLAPTGVFRTAQTAAWSLSASLAMRGFVEIHLSGAAPLAGASEVAWVTFRIAAQSATTTSFRWVSAVLDGGAIPGTGIDSHLAVEMAAVTIEVSDALTGASGSQIVVPVFAGGLAGASSFDIAVAYDSGVLQAVRAQTAALTSCMTMVYNIQTTGIVRIALYGTCSVSGSGPVANVVFDVIGPNGSRSPIDITRGGIDEGWIGSVLDDGMFLACEMLDRDGDGASGCAGDCNDSDPSVHPGAAEICNGTDDDCDGDADDVPLPSGSPSLYLGKTADSAILSWSAAGSATAYDAVRGDLGALLAQQGAFADSTNACLLNGSLQRYASDPSLPPPGEGYWYLVRALNCGGLGTYDTGSDSQVGLRDPGIAGSPNRCP